MLRKTLRYVKAAAGMSLRLYVAPLRVNERVLHAARGLYLTTGHEHLYRAVRIIRRNHPELKEPVIVDVGAADGGTAVFFTDHFPGVKIVAFEPNPRMLAEVRRRFAGVAGIDIRSVALGGSQGEGALHITANNVSSSLSMIDDAECSTMSPAASQNFRVEATVPVTVSTLDHELVAFGEILLIKLDTQGTELDILSGGLGTLRRTRYVLIEMNNHKYYKSTCQYYDVDEFLRGQQFRMADVTVSFHSDEGTKEFDCLYENTRFSRG